jgi:hypothetical protein
MWGLNSKKNLYISSLLSNFHNLVLYDNNLFKNVLFPNDNSSYRKFIVTAIEFDINKAIDISNNLTYYINTFDQSISDMYNYKRIQTKTIETNLTVNYDYESLSYLENYLMLKIRKLLLNYDSLNLTNNVDILYNSEYFTLKIANSLFKDLYYILENSFVVFRFQIEVLKYNLDMILMSGKLFELNIIDILIYSVFFICLVILMIFILLLTSITNYKIEILKIFFLIDKKWSDIIIRRCRKYLEESREFLQKDNKKIRDKNFFDERDDVEYLENQIKKEEHDRLWKENFNLDREDDYKDGEESLVRLTSNNINHNNYIPNKTNNLGKNFDLKYSHKNSGLDSIRVKSNPDAISPKKKNKKNVSSDYKSIVNEGDNLKKVRKNLNQSFDEVLTNGIKENENEVKQATSVENEEERNRLEHSISNFRRTKWMNSFKIFFLLLLICIYFLIVLIMNKDFINDFKQNSYYVTLIGERGWNFNNLLIYFREMLIQGKKKSNHTILDENGLYTYGDLDGLDLYSLYYNKSSKIENTVQSIYNIKSILLKDFIKIDTLLNSKEFCFLLKNYNIEFIEIDEKYCQQFKSFSNINGLSNYIGFITNFCYNNFYMYSNKDKSLNLNFSTITSVLRDENLALQININQIIIFRAFLLELNILCDSIISYLNYFNDCTLIRICFFFVLIIFEVSIFIYLANILKKLINEDKAILTIIPSEAISINEKIKNAFQFL